MDAYDLHVLFEHRDVLLSQEPGLRFLGRAPRGPKKVALLSGSFNPPTSAHQLIAERAKADGFDAAVFVLPTSVAGKEPGGLIAEDRLLALRMIAPRASLGIAVASGGLYVEQAEAAARACPDAELHFLVGSDKILQIFEPDWYEDREAALDRLFSLASFVVAPRAADGPRLREALESPENRAYADAVRVVALHPSVADLSSTRVRGLLEAGADASGYVAPAVANLLADLRPFARPQRIAGEIVDPYQVRSRLIDALWEVREWAERAADLRALVALATASSPDGARIRRALALGGPGPEELFRLHALTGA